MEEVWKEIIGFENSHKISNLGRVKSISRSIWNGEAYFISKEKLLNPSISNDGYFKCCLTNGFKKQVKNIHQIVANHFIENTENKRTVNHKDGNKLNNRVDNLEWSTHSENLKHSYDIGLRDHIRIRATQLNKKKEIIAVFKSLKEAETKTGVCSINISSCIKGRRKTAGGFIWVS